MTGGEYVGHKNMKHGQYNYVQPLDGKVQAFMEAPSPQNASQLITFLPHLLWQVPLKFVFHSGTTALPTAKAKKVVVGTHTSMRRLSKAVQKLGASVQKATCSTFFFFFFLVG